MRVIAGEYKGHPLKTLPTNDTRPTTGRVKESLMSAIVSARGGFDDAVVLDAFAGTGQLGIEALSRGAQYAVFCDNARMAQSVIMENLKACKIPSDSYRLIKRDYYHPTTLSYFAGKRQFNLVFFDPPYAHSCEDVCASIRALDEQGLLAVDVLICYEFNKNAIPTLNEWLNAVEWQAASIRTYGDTALALIRRSI